nr:hypothetical protein [uncultured Campylobacter sp.]
MAELILKDALKMRYLGGHDGEGCAYLIEFRSNVRRVFYHFTMYGFIFCFIATVFGAIYLHNLNLEFLRNSRLLFK